MFVIGLGLLFAICVPNAFAVFHREDFLITNIGVSNGVPFMELQGQPGRSFSVSGGDESYYAYTFVTNNGIFAASVALDEDGNKPYYSADHFDIKKFQIGECVNHRTLPGNQNSVVKKPSTFRNKLSLQMYQKLTLFKL